MNKELSHSFMDKLNKLNHASEKHQMNLVDTHPWDEAYDENVLMKKVENISIYGTEFWYLATDEEKISLAKQETGVLWNTFIVFENLVTEYYLKIINHESLIEFPGIVEYMHHFCKEELVHAMVFRKAMNHFKITPFPVAQNLKDFYMDNASLVDFPLKAIYMTIMIEWFAENTAINDMKSNDISPLARAVAIEHHKEEARHIEWGKQMVKEFAIQIPNFLEEARDFTPFWLRTLLDMSTCNPESYERVGFKHPAFENVEGVIEAAIFSERRAEINDEIMKPILKFCSEVGLYDDDVKELWISNRFGAIVEELESENLVTI
jgi:hypothetical protein